MKGYIILLWVNLVFVGCFVTPQLPNFNRFNAIKPPGQSTVFFGNSGNDKEATPSNENEGSEQTVAFQGAGIPRPDLPPEEIPSLLMNALVLNDFPHVDAGLMSMWEFAGDSTRHIFEKNLTDFIESAHETADTMPTSFYGAAMYGKSWNMETELNRVGGTEGWIATQIMKTISSDGRLRRWQWELRKNRRPPCLGCWFVESIGSSDRKGQFEAE